MAQLVNVAHRGMAEQMASHDLNSLEFAIPRAFLDQDEWTTTQPTQVLSVKASRKSRLADQLVETGLMARRFPSEDRRVVFLALTNEGKASTPDLHRRVQAYDATLTWALGTPERAATVKILDDSDAEVLPRFNV